MFKRKNNCMTPIIEATVRRYRNRQQAPEAGPACDVHREWVAVALYGHCQILFNILYGVRCTESSISSRIRSKHLLVMMSGRAAEQQKLDLLSMCRWERNILEISSNGSSSLPRYITRPLLGLGLQQSTP
jgi:hypothetical protein